jgi:putative transposase
MPDNSRHGTTTLFASMDVTTGEVSTLCKLWRWHQEFLRFLRQIEKSVPEDIDLHLILDNSCTQKHAKVRACLAHRPRFHVHYTPTYHAWLNQVERWFGIITQRAIHRGSFSDVEVLIARIEPLVATNNKTKAPFNWSQSADSILATLWQL